MKKILSIVMACILAFAVMLPCVALGRDANLKSGAPKCGEVIEFGMWPQTRITSIVTCSILNFQLNELLPGWETDVLPDGTVVQYADLIIDKTASPRPTYRVVRIGGTNQWYRWEPLQWEAIEYEGFPAMVCTSVVTAAQDDSDAVVAWLNGTFSLTAFTPEERAACHGLGVPTVGMTNSSAADVGDYAALYGADGTNYLQLPNPSPDLLVTDLHQAYGPVAPDENTPARGAKGGSTTDVKKVEKRLVEAPNAPAKGTGEPIGVRPIMVLTSQTAKAGGVICCILRWIFGHSH